MNENQKRQILKLAVSCVALFFAPLWIPLAIITAFTLAGMAAAAGVFLSGFLTVFTAVFGVPLLFSLAVTAMAYLAMKAFTVIVQRAHELFTRCMRELEIAPAKIIASIQLNLKQFLKVGNF